ncbi:MAG: hypothetical protein Q7W55_08520 [Pseudohongiella sp.]|nr:hypothetical protein [Pseudohongiella sp.]MDP2128486.1 hypothetical protein [Pseudohongiella sp.]
MTTSNSDPDIRNMKREAGAMANEKAETVQHQIADGADALSDAIDAAASNLDEHDREGLARYARTLSSNISDMAGQLERRSVDELATDAKQLARNNPALFMLGSIAVGFGLSRFFKASAEHDHQNGNKARRTDSSRDYGIPEGGPVRQSMTARPGTSNAGLDSDGGSDYDATIR